MKFRAAVIAMVALLIGGCATTKPHESPTVIGPFITFSGRLIVIEPTRRWQVIVDWNGTPEEGDVRLTHAASNRIVLVKWDNENILILDNADQSGSWRSISGEALAEKGIILPPRQLARILSGEMPAGLIEKQHGEWEGRIDDSFLRIKWFDEKQHLELIDVTHGRTATLIINP